MTAERVIEFGDRGERQEDIAITATTFIDDNYSPDAVVALGNFDTARYKGNLTAIQRCSDARVTSSIGGPESETISVGSVAAAGSPSEKLAQDRGIGRWIELTHIDGATIKPGEMPRGCGGLAAKENEASVEGTEIQSWIGGTIDDKDALVQSVRQAERIADISGKPVAAWTMDHRTDTIYPIAFFQKKGNSMISVSAIREYDLANYDPKRIYSEGIPTVNEAEIPDEFRPILKAHELKQAEIRRRYPRFDIDQEVQNPRLVIFSTDIRSLSHKFPRLARIPGIAFKVFGARDKVGEDVQITEEALKVAFGQMWYAIKHSVDNSNDPTKPFSKTDQLVIETPDLSLSRHVWDKAMERPWMQEWISLPGKMVILLQTNAGRINDAAEIVR